MQTPDYFWNYLPLLMQILVAVGFGAGNRDRFLVHRAASQQRGQAVVL